MLGEAITQIHENLYQHGGYVSNGWLVPLLPKHLLIRSPLRLYFLHELA